jgi:GT2 family glycosyltransferase
VRAGTTIPAFSAPPAAVIFLMRADLVRELGRWEEEYEIASAEDVDLCFKVWVNDLDIVYDQRVLVDHIGKGSASRLDDWIGLWARNRQLFLDKWTSDREIPRLATCDPTRHARNRVIAASVAGWMERYFTVRDQASVRKSVSGAARATTARATKVRAALVRRARPVWRKVSPHLPPEVRRVIRATARRLR